MARERGLEAREEDPRGKESLTQARRCPRRAIDVGLGKPEELRAEEAREVAQEARRGPDEMLDVWRRLGADPEGRSCKDVAERNSWRRAIAGEDNENSGGNLGL